MPQRCQGLRGEAKRRCELRLYGRPGKYQGELHITQYMHDLTMDGADEEVGDVSESGVWYGLLRGKLDEDVARAAHEKGERLTSGEKKFLKKQVGAIVSENVIGFVHVDYYTNKMKLERHWRGIEKEMEAWESSWQDPYDKPY